MSELLDLIAGPVSRILDCGCHEGHFSAACRERWPNAYIVGIDANPHFADTNQLSMLDEFHQALLWSRDGVMIDYHKRKEDLDIGTTGNSVFRERTSFYGEEAERAGEMQVITLPTIRLDSMGFDKPFDLVKFDLQGSEISAMRGGKNLLSRTRWLICELQLVCTNTGAPSACDVMKEIAAQGFTKQLDFSLASVMGEHVDVLHERERIDRIPSRHIIAANIKRLLEEQSKSVDWLACEANVLPHYIRDMRDGGGDLPLGMIDRIAMALGVLTPELFEVHGEGN